MDWTEDRIPDQTGRVTVVTGGNTGLGFETARALAEHGASVVIAVRDVDKGRRAAAAIKGAVAVQRLDLTSLESVHEASADLHRTHPRIDLLINNAGVMWPPRQVTRDGFELQLGTNHLGHFALTGLLLDLMLPVPGSRVVTVSSITHRGARIDFDDLQSERAYSRFRAYGQSKLANLMFTYELQRRLAPHGTTEAVAAHPGVAATELLRNAPAVMKPFRPLIGLLMSQNPQMGALASLRAATDPAVLGGQYYGPTGLGATRGHPQVNTSSPESYDVLAQQRLWSLSEELTGVKFPV